MATSADPYYNPTTGAGGNIWFQTSDPYDVDGSTQTLIAGTTGFALQMYQAGSQTLGMYHTQGTYSTGTVANIPITAGTINRVLLLVPGETFATGGPPYNPANGGFGGKTPPDVTTPWVAGTSPSCIGRKRLCACLPNAASSASM